MCIRRCLNSLLNLFQSHKKTCLPPPVHQRRKVFGFKSSYLTNTQMLNGLYACTAKFTKAQINRHLSNIFSFVLKSKIIYTERKNFQQLQKGNKIKKNI